METTTHTIGDLTEIYGNMLSYIRQDAEARDPGEHDENDEYCPTKLYKRGQTVYDDSKLWRLMRAAPDLLAECRIQLRNWNELRSGKWDGSAAGIQAAIDGLEEVIAKAA